MYKLVAQKEKMFLFVLFFFLLISVRSQTVSLSIFYDGAFQYSKRVKFNVDSISRKIDSELADLVADNYLNASFDSLVYISSKKLNLYFQRNYRWNFSYRILGLDTSLRNRLIELSERANSLGTFRSISGSYLFFLQKKGFPFAKLNYSLTFLGDTSFVVSANYAQMQFFTIKDVKIVPNKQVVHSSILSRYLNLIKGDYFDKEKWTEAFEKLKVSTKFEMIKQPEFELSEQGALLYFYLQSKKQSNASGFLGFQTQKEDLNILGEAEINLENTFHSLESLHLKWYADEKKQRQLNLSIKIPYVFSSPIGLNSHLDILQEDTSSVNFKFNSAISYSQSNQLSFSIKSYYYSSYRVGLQEGAKSYFMSGIGLEWEKHLYSVKNHFKATILSSNISSSENSRQTIQFFNEFRFYFFRKWELSSINSLQYFEANKLVKGELTPLGGLSSFVGISENEIWARNYLAMRLAIKVKQKISPIGIIDYMYYNQLEPSYNHLFSVGYGFEFRQKQVRLQLVNALVLAKNNNQLRNSKLHLKIISYF